MKQQWQNYSDKFSQYTEREQLLIFATGLVAIFFIISYFFIDDKSAKTDFFDKKSVMMKTNLRTLDFSINEYQNALNLDPDTDVIKQIEQLEAKLTNIDNQLVFLTTDLISPIEMRQALLKLLKLEPGVSLLSFELIGAKPLLNLKAEVSDTNRARVKTVNSSAATNSPSPEQLGLNLYKHGIKLKLSGEYFQLRNYLRQLEQLSWKFFWQDFQFEVKEYPKGEVDILIYSLGLHKEFVGV